MYSKRWTLAVLASALSWACGEPAAGPGGPLAPSFAKGGVGRPSVLVNPNADDNGTAKTIQEGIEMVAEGGKVMVLPGIYDERIVIDKGLTLEGIGDDREAVRIVTPSGLPNATIQVTTSHPVTIRDLAVMVSAQNGILAQGIFDLTLDRLTMVTVAVTATGANRLVRPENDASVSGGRARLVVRNSVFDAAGLPRTLAISIAADLAGVIEGNTIRGTGNSCVFLLGRSSAGIDVDVVDNDFGECSTILQNGSAIEVGQIGVPAGPRGDVGVINIVGNTIRNTRASCPPHSAIRYELYTGRIERNSIIGFVQQCAVPTVLARPAAIWVGSLRGFPPASPVVRFNDIEGNAHAGLRIAPNITMSVDARCNWWGSASGPSGVGPGTGDAVVVETGGATPTFMPFATAPTAESGATSC